MRVKTETMVQKKMEPGFTNRERFRKCSMTSKKYLQRKGCVQRSILPLVIQRAVMPMNLFLRFPVCSVMHSGVEVKEFIWIFL